MFYRFRCLGHYWTLRALGVPLLLASADVCIPHSCHCGGRLDSRGLHGLSCKYSAGRFPRHSAMNYMINRALQKAGLGSVLVPPGLDRGDWSRPDGITDFPFSGSRSLVWDCTCANTFAGVHLNISTLEADKAANTVEVRKCRKYTTFAEAHQFEPIAVQTMWVFGGSTGVILRAIVLTLLLGFYCTEVFIIYIYYFNSWDILEA